MSHHFLMWVQGGFMEEEALGLGKKDYHWEEELIMGRAAFQWERMA